MVRTSILHQYMTYHYTIIMLLFASIVQAFFMIMFSDYSNLIDIKVEKLLFRILLVSYTRYGPTSWSHLDHVALQFHFKDS
jgi:hypothetical protein